MREKLPGVTNEELVEKIKSSNLKASEIHLMTQGEITINLASYMIRNLNQNKSISNPSRMMLWFACELKLRNQKLKAVDVSEFYKEEKIQPQTAMEEKTKSQEVTTVSVDATVSDKLVNIPEGAFKKDQDLLYLKHKKVLYAAQYKGEGVYTFIHDGKPISAAVKSPDSYGAFEIINI